MKLIKLSQGLFAQVDDSDFEYLNHFKWYAHRSRKDTFYAKRNYVRLDGKRGIQNMHELLTGIKGTDHEDGNGLNNQRTNLRDATPQQQAQNRGKKTGKDFKGVRKYKTDKGFRYMAYVNVGGFETALEAAQEYDRIAAIAYGEFARLNLPKETQ